MEPKGENDEHSFTNFSIPATNHPPRQEIATGLLTRFHPRHNGRTLPAAAPGCWSRNRRFRPAILPFVSANRCPPAGLRLN